MSLNLTTKITEFRGLTKEQASLLTPRAKNLTYGDLVEVSRHTPKGDLLSLSLEDVQSISAAFATYDPAKIQSGAMSVTADAACCCCTCCPCCSCTAATVIQPLQN
jgi:hypothetical protein